MPRSLRDQIRERLARPIHADRFEACAVELLRPRYASLSWIPGPNDAGQDGVGETETGTKFFLVATTSADYAQNLRKSIRSYLDAGGDRRAVVLATTRVVSGRRLLQLPQQIEEEFGVSLLAIHHQETFVELLAEHSTWRQDLLDLTAGPVTGLTRRFQRLHTDLALGLVGRATEVHSLLEAAGDLVVYGLPGVGKSYLLEYLCREHDWGWLIRDRDSSMPDLADEIIEKQPARVIVDDAHFDVQVLTRLVQLRAECTHPFDLVACCWESGKDDISERLPGAQQIDIPQLERGDIAAIVGAVGVSGPRQLIASIIDQAQGRTGFAVTLARASMSGEGWDVLAGRVLARQVLAFNRRYLPDEFRYELGAIALADGQGLTEEELAGALERDYIAVASAIRQAASSGAIDMASTVDRRLRVQPRGLRFGLVREAFFSGPGSLDVRRVLSRFEHRAVAAIPLIVVAAQEPTVDRRLIEDLIDWNDRESACAFAGLGIREFERAAANAPQHLPDIARSAMPAHGLDERILNVLLHAAKSRLLGTGEDQDHPLTIIRRQLTARHSSVVERERVAQGAVRWAERGGDSIVAAQAILSTVDPAVDEGELDPVEQNRISIYRGIQPLSLLRKLDPIWDRALAFCRAHPEVPPKLALDALHPWIYPDTMRDDGRIPPEVSEALRATAQRVATQLDDIYRDRPLALTRLASMASRGGLEVEPSGAPFVLALYGSRSPGEPDRVFDSSDLEADARQRIEQFANESAPRAAQELAAEIAHLESEAAAAGVHPPPLLPMYAAELTARTGSPVAFARALTERRCQATVVAAVAAALHGEQGRDLDELAQELLHDDPYHRIGTNLALQPGLSKSTRAQALSLLRTNQADDVVFYFRTGLIVWPEIKELVERTEYRLGQEVALTACFEALETKRDTPQMTESLQQACRDRVAGYRQSGLGDRHQSWMLEHVLRRDLDLCARWIERWMGDAVTNFATWLPDGIEDVSAALEPDARRSLIDLLPAQITLLPAPRQVRGLVRGLVDGDDDLVRHFLRRGDLDHFCSALFEGDLDEAWLHRVEIAVETGCSADQITQWTNSGSFGWSGDESTEWTRRIGLLEELRRQSPGNERAVVVDAIDTIIATFERRRTRAAEEEKRERVHGRRA